jgi:hypothetical protein
MIVVTVIVIVLVVIISTVIYSFFRKRHGELISADTRNLVKTDEIFRDPSTNRLMRVWVDTTDGKRVYIAEGKFLNDI